MAESPRTTKAIMTIRAHKIVVGYFSGGVSSAVAIKLIANDLDRILYTHIDDQHPDTLRFVADCQTWFGQVVEITQSPLGSVENACRSASFLKSRNGGAACTKRLKRDVRKAFERKHAGNMTCVWGLDVSEQHRVERIQQTMSEHTHRFPLIEANITKQEAHAILRASGIQRPVMYDLGYHNNNCVGCIKGGMGYWNKIRIDFPDVFKSRAKLERLLGFPVIGKGIWLDELDPTRGRHAGPICDDCGIMCETMAADFRKP